MKRRGWLRTLLSTLTDDFHSFTPPRLPPPHFPIFYVFFFSFVGEGNGRRPGWHQNPRIPSPQTPTPTRAARPFNTPANNLPSPSSPANPTPTTPWPLNLISAPTAQAQRPPLPQQCRSFLPLQRVLRLACRPRSHGHPRVYAASLPARR